MEVRVNKPEFQRFITSKVQAGHFPTPEAVVEDALGRMMEEELTLTEGDVAAINEAEIAMDRGEHIDFDAFAREMRNRHPMR